MGSPWRIQQSYHRRHDTAVLYEFNNNVKNLLLVVIETDDESTLHHHAAVMNHPN